MNKNRANRLISQFSRHRIAVIGDIILDRYLWGTATRISPEAPVPILHLQRETVNLGGAANVMQNISSIGAQAFAFGVVGDDRNADTLRSLCQTYHIATEGIMSDTDRQTTVKTRLLAEHQQMVRFDDECGNPIPMTIRDKLTEIIEQLIKKESIDAIILSDYHKGVLSQSFAESIQQLSSTQSLPIAMDPHPENKILLTHTVLLTPNRIEAFKLAGESVETTGSPSFEHDTRLHKVGKILLCQWQPECLLITLGSEGMALYEAQKEPTHIATHAKEVFDVSGAGDTVIAVYVLALLSGASSLEAATLANHAAGIVVSKLGIVPIKQSELIKCFS